MPRKARALQSQQGCTCLAKAFPPADQAAAAAAQIHLRCRANAQPGFQLQLQQEMNRAIDAAAAHGEGLSVEVGRLEALKVAQTYCALKQLPCWCQFRLMPKMRAEAAAVEHCLYLCMYGGTWHSWVVSLCPLLFLSMIRSSLLRL